MTFSPYRSHDPCRTFQPATITIWRWRWARIANWRTTNLPMVATRAPPLRSLRIQALLLSLNAVLDEVIPLIVEVDCAQREHGLGTFNFPTHAGQFHAILHEVPACSFHDSRADRIAICQVLVVLHVLPIVFEVRDRLAYRLCLAALQFRFTEHPLVEANHMAHFAFQQQAQMPVDLPFGVARAFAVESVGHLPQPLHHMEDVEHPDCPGEPTVLQIPERPLAIHQAD